MSVRSANINVRIDSEIKTKAAAVLDVLGISESTFIYMAYRQLILHDWILFSDTNPRKITVLEEMTHEELHTMLSKGIVQVENGEILPLDDAFREILKKL